MRILLGEPDFAEAARLVLERVGTVVPFERFEQALPEAGALVVGLEVVLTRELLARAEHLEVIATRTSQLRHIDLEETRRRGIEILSIEPDAPALRETSSTAEETWALVLALARNVPWAFDALKDGRWERRRFGGNELAGKTIGLIGLGRLGRMVAGYARAFGMDVLATDPALDTGATVDGARIVGLDELVRSSDVVSVHCTFSEETRGLLTAAHFGAMKPTALFVNTARGEITDEAALLAALESGEVAGAAVDTLAGEMPDGSHLRGNPLVEYARRSSNLIVLPHLGGATAEATERTQVYICERLAAYLRSRG